GTSFFIIGTVVMSAGRTADCVVWNETQGTASIQNNSIGILRNLYSNGSVLAQASTVMELIRTSIHVTSGLGIVEDYEEKGNGRLSASDSNTFPAICEANLRDCAIATEVPATNSNI